LLASFEGDEDIQMVEKTDLVCGQSALVCQEVSKRIVKISEDMDDNLRLLLLGLSSEGQSMLFLYAQVIMASLWEKCSRLRSMKPVQLFLESKEREKDLFVARLTCNDAKVDRSQSNLVVAHCVDFFKNQILDQIRIGFDSKIKELSGRYKKVDVIDKMEKDILDLADRKEAQAQYVCTSDDQVAINRVVEFYLNPTAFLDNEAN